MKSLLVLLALMSPTNGDTRDEIREIVSHLMGYTCRGDSNCGGTRTCVGYRKEEWLGEFAKLTEVLGRCTEGN